MSKVNKIKKEQKKYKANNRINLTYLKYQDRRKVGKKAVTVGKKIEEFNQCPYCKSDEGYFREELTESLTRYNFGFNHSSDEREPEREVKNLIWENKNYSCRNCSKAISHIEKQKEDTEPQK